MDRTELENKTTNYVENIKSNGIKFEKNINPTNWNIQDWPLKTSLEIVEVKSQFLQNWTRVKVQIIKITKPNMREFLYEIG